MKTEIRPENEMKDSGVEWIGSIPSSWMIFPANKVFCEVKEKNRDLKYVNAFSFKYGEIVDKMQVGDVDDNLQETLSSYTVVKKNNIMINGLNLNYDFVSQRVAIVNETGVITSAYLAVQPDESKLNPKYVLYLLKSYDFQQVFHGLGSGIRKTLKYKDFKAVMIVAPQLFEQQAIADYLDEVCSKIDEIIAEARASIEEYKELKQAVIFEAVTKGLDNKVEMKDVNIEYLESCPMDWHILPISMLFDFFGGFAYKSDRFCEKTNNQVIRLGNVKDDELRLNSNPVYVSDEYANASSKATIKVDDILFTMTGTRGKGDYFYTLIITENDLKDRNLLLNQRVGCFRKAYHTVYMPYYNYLLKSSKIRERVFLYETGTANQGNIGIENINRIRLYNPPMEVQKNIVITLKHKCSEIDSLITEKEALIADLEAYKKSLIYELVTGKRRVV